MHNHWSDRVLTLKREHLSCLQELFHLVYFLDLLHEDVLSHLRELGQILPLRQQVIRLLVDVEPGPVEVFGGDKHIGLLVIKALLEIDFGNRVLLPELDLLIEAFPVFISAQLRSNHYICLLEGDLMKLLALVGLQ